MAKLKIISDRADIADIVKSAISVEIKNRRSA